VPAFNSCAATSTSGSSAIIPPPRPRLPLESYLRWKYTPSVTKIREGVSAVLAGGQARSAGPGAALLTEGGSIRRFAAGTGLLADLAGRLGGPPHRCQGQDQRSWAVGGRGWLTVPGTEKVLRPLLGCTADLPCTGHAAGWLTQAGSWMPRNPEWINPA